MNRQRQMYTRQQAMVAF